MDKNTASSEVIAVVILIAIFAVAVGIVGVVLLSNPPDDEAPAMLASVTYDNSTDGDHRLLIRHEGGDPLRKGEFQIFVNGEDRTDEVLGEDGSRGWTVWENGQVITLGLGSDPMPDGVLITSAGIRGSGSAWVLHLIGEGAIVIPVPTTTATPGVLVASFTASPASGPAPLSVTFTDTSTGGPDSWYWDFGDNTTSIEQSPSHTFQTTGSYTVRLTVRNSNGESDTATRTIAVIGPPVANFSASQTSGIIPLHVWFTDASTGAPASWSWDFGDGTTSTEQHPDHIYTAPGTYTVSLTVSNTAGTDTTVRTIRVSTSAGEGLVGTYYPNRGWTGEGVTRIDPRIWFADNEANTSSWLRAGTDEYNWPIATLGKDDQFSVIYEGYLIVPEDAAYTFYLTSDDGSWLWIDDMDTVLIDNGGYHSSTTKTANIHLTAGSHQIRAKMFENSGKAVFHLEWSSPAFARTPVEDFCHDPVAVAASFTAAPQSGTAPLQVQFTDTSTGEPAAWLWDFGDGTNSTEQHPFHTYTAPGTYTVSLTAANAAFSDTAARIDLITAETPTITEGFWPMDEGSGSIVYDKSGNGYDGTITGAGWISCADRGYLVFDGSSDSISIPNSAGLNPTNAVTYEAWAYPTEYDTDKVIQKRDWDGHGLDLDKWNGWQGGVTTASGKTTIRWGEGRPALNRWYHLALTYDGSTLRLYVDGEEKASTPLTGTLKTSTSPVYIGSDANTQKWFNGSIANAAIYSTALSPQEIGAHHAAFTPAGCPADAAFSADVVSGTAPLTVQFTDLSTRHPTAWLWDFGDGTTSGVQNPFHIYADPGTYTVSLTASNLFGPGTETKTDYITVGGSFTDFIIDENVFVYGNTLKFSGNTVTGPGATVVITGGLVTSDLNGGASISVSKIYIDGDVTLDGGSAGLGSAADPGNIYVNGDLTLGSGSRNIYGDTYVAGNFFLKDARIHGNVYVDGDLTLGWTPWIADGARIYYTGTFTHPSTMSPGILSKCIQQATVPGFDMPDQQIPPTKPAEWYAARGYVSGGALTDGIKIYAESYSSTSWRPSATNVIVIARTGDITITGMGGSGITGVFFAPNGKVTFGGASLEGVVIARDGFFVTSGGTTVTFRNLDHYISNPDDYPF